MAEGKERIGYQTSAKQLENTFEMVLAELRSEQIVWDNILETLEASRQKWMQTPESESPVAIEMLKLLLLSHDLISMLVCVVGKSIAETHERLATVEKVVGNLKLKLK